MASSQKKQFGTPYVLLNLLDLYLQTPFFKKVVVVVVVMEQVLGIQEPAE